MSTMTIREIREFNDDELTLDVADYAEEYADAYSVQREAIATLLAVVEKYGGHVWPCPAHRGMVNSASGPCTCGWDAINGEPAK